MVHTHFLKPLLGAVLLTLFLSLWVGITEAQILDVQQKGSYLYTYDERSRQIASMPMGSSDRFRSAAGNYFNVQKGSYIYTYDRHCKQTHSRSAN